MSEDWLYPEECRLSAICLLADRVAPEKLEIPASLPPYTMGSIRGDAENGDKMEWVR